MPEIVAINLSLGIAITDEDTVVRLTNFIGADGNECEWDEAVAAVGWEPGQDGGGRWWSIDISEFQDVFLQ